MRLCREGVIDAIVGEAGPQAAPCSLSNTRCYRSSGDEPKLSISERNLAFMWIYGNLRIQLAGVAH